jgi:D-threo-aldose 1-dehydrogenase
LPECLRRGTAIVVGGAFNSGILATGARPVDGSPPFFDYAPAPAPIVERVEAIERVCADFGAPLKAAALQFPTGHPAVVNVVVGARSSEELDQNLAMRQYPIPSAFWRALIDQGLLDPSAPLPGSFAAAATIVETSPEKR